MNRNETKKHITAAKILNPTGKTVKQLKSDICGICGLTVLVSVFLLIGIVGGIETGRMEINGALWALPISAAACLAAWIIDNI